MADAQKPNVVTATPVVARAPAPVQTAPVVIRGEPGLDAPDPGAGADAQHKLLQPLPPGKAPYVTRTGEIRLVQDDPRTHEEARRAGWRMASPQEVRDEQGHQLYGDWSGQLATGALNAFDAIAMGYGKGAMVAGAGLLGGPEAEARMRTGIEVSDRENKWARRVGTGLGIAAGLVEGMPASLIARGAGAAAKALPVLGEGAGFLASGSRMALQGGAEMAVWEAGNAFTEAELGDEDLTAEKLWSAANKGFLVGMGLGGGLFVAGKALSKMAPLMPSGGLRGMAEKLASHASGAGSDAIQHMEAEGIDAVKRGSFILDTPEIGEVLWKGRQPDLAKAARTALDRIGRDVGEGVEGIQAAAEKAGRAPDIRTMLREANEVVAKLDRVPGYEGVVKSVRTYLENYGLKTGVLERLEDGSLVETGSTGKITFKDLHDFRVKLDDKIFNPSGDVRGLGDTEKQLKRDIRDVQIRAFRGPAAEFAPQELTRFQEASDKYHVAVNMTEAMEKAAGRHEARNVFGLPDYAVSGIGGVAGALVGGAPGAALGSVATSVASKIIREHGPAFAAAVLDRAARLGALRQVIAGQDEKISAVARMAAQPGGRGAPRTVALSSARRAKKAAEHLSLMAGQPEAVIKAAGGHIDPSAAPVTRAKYLELAQRTAWYLMSHRPRGAARNPALPGVGQQEASASEWERWGYRYDVAVDPIGGIAAAIRKGRLSEEHVETLDDLYPGIGRQLREGILSEVGRAQSRGRGPGYARLTQLSVLLGVPLDPTMRPEFIRSQQKVVAMPFAQMDTLYDDPAKMGTSAAANAPRPRSTGAGRKRPRMRGSGEGSLDVGMAPMD